VTTGRTGHAESVQIKYNPREISYGQILKIFFSVVHDPTQLNRQGPDVGTHYRSAIFYANDEQKKIAEAYVAQLGEAGIFKSPIVTKVGPLVAFYPAEAYHQDYAIKHPTQPYIAIHDLPKVDNLKRLFPNMYRSNPVTVASR
jgi:peptide-methionine (S)-S-oxide reductase